jgi:hypothetical protein
MSARTAILVASFAGNSEIWSLADFFLRKYWPEMPYEVYLGANGEDRGADVPAGWKYLNLGPDRSWSESMRDYLAAMPAESVFLLLDDFLLCGAPDAQRIAAAARMVEGGEADYVILHAKRSPGRPVDEGFSRIRRYDDSLTTLKPEIWNKAFFASLLGLGLDPWEFERKAYLFPEARKGRYLAVRKDAYPIRHCLEKGRYQPWLAGFLAEEGCSFSPDVRRPVLRPEDLAARKKAIGRLRRLFFRLFEHGYPNYIAKKIAYRLKEPRK